MQYSLLDSGLLDDPVGLRASIGRFFLRIARRLPRKSPVRGLWGWLRARSRLLPVPGRHRVALALQGGGVHGALTWGILDRILENDRLEITAVSGTSAGALSAAALVSGLAEGGPEQARLRLRELWDGIAEIGSFSPFRPGLIDPLAPSWNSDWAAGTLMLEMLTRTLSPYQLNPLAINPLRQLIERVVDFELLRASPIKLFITATRVKTGRPRVFTTPEITADAILASACLPSFHQAIEIDGEFYWDGGFTANPAILPLISGSTASDIIVVQITPTQENEVPVTARDIQSRVNRIIFNAPLQREIETVAWMQTVLKDSGIYGNSFAQRVRDLRIHHVDGQEIIGPLGTASAIHADGALISHLYEQGRARADEWLGRFGGKIGIESTAELKQH